MTIMDHLWQVLYIKLYIMTLEVDIVNLTYNLTFRNICSLEVNATGGKCRGSSSSSTELYQKLD